MELSTQPPEEVVAVEVEEYRVEEYRVVEGAKAIVRVENVPDIFFMVDSTQSAGQPRRLL